MASLPSSSPSTHGTFIHSTPHPSTPPIHPTYHVASRGTLQFSLGTTAPPSAWMGSPKAASSAGKAGGAAVGVVGGREGRAFFFFVLLRLVAGGRAAGAAQLHAVRQHHAVLLKNDVGGWVGLWWCLHSRIHSMLSPQARHSDGNGRETDLSVWGRKAAAQAWTWQARSEDVASLAALCGMRFACCWVGGVGGVGRDGTNGRVCCRCPRLLPNNYTQLDPKPPQPASSAAPTTSARARTPDCPVCTPKGGAACFVQSFPPSPPPAGPSCERYNHTYRHAHSK